MLYDTLTRPPDPVRTSRWLAPAGAVALAAIALVHLAELPDEWEEHRFLGASFVFLVVAASTLAVALLRRRGGRATWLLAGALASGTAVAFLLSRTAGLPGDAEEVGAWTALGVASLAVEAFAVVLAAVAVGRHRAARG